jgi:hypothetical protein
MKSTTILSIMRTIYHQYVRFSIIMLALLAIAPTLSAQKYLLLERANNAKTVKYKAGDELSFRLEGEENYWYKREITDILPDSKSLLLDNYLVKVEEIAAIKRPPRTVFRVVGLSSLSFGVGLGFATLGAVLYRDWSQNYPLLIGVTGASLLTSKIMLRPRKVNMNEKNRLRAVEIKFGVQ